MLAILVFVRLRELTLPMWMLSWVEPTYPEELYQALQAHKADIAVANYSVYKESEDLLFFTSRMKIITSRSIHPTQIIDGLF